MKHYDPNINWSTHTVKVTLMQWEYTAAIEVKVNGNCEGFTIMESAVSMAFESLPFNEGFEDESEISYITLVDPEGNELLCEDDEQCCESWFNKMVVSVEIISRDKKEPS